MEIGRTESGLFVPVFSPFEVGNKDRHTNGEYHGVATTCPDGKISRVNTKHLARINGLPECRWDTALFDILNLVGASRGFIDPTLRNASLSQLEFLIRGHRVKRYTLIDHDGCSAYQEELENSVLRDDEELFHTLKLQEASGIIHERLPELEVILVYSQRVGEKIRFTQVPPSI